MRHFSGHDLAWQRRATGRPAAADRAGVDRPADLQLAGGSHGPRVPVEVKTASAPVKPAKSNEVANDRLRTGDQVFVPAIAALAKLRDDVANGQDLAVSQQDLAAVDVQINTVVGIRADFGSKINSQASHDVAIKV